jgi:UDP-N-acetylmuramyl pentapeptide synthase
MISRIKKQLYFTFASYFAFFAKIRLIIWKPKIVVITGSSGKTTLLHMIESQLGKSAKYSHRANSSFGIPFDILNLERNNLTLSEWPFLFIKAPLSLFKPLPKEKLYIVEADCDRPFEGEFLGRLLKPNTTLWINTTTTHSMNFEDKAKKLNKSLLEVITQEFGNFAKNTKKLVIYNKDQANLDKYVNNLNVKKTGVTTKDLKYSYSVDLFGTKITINNKTYNFNYLLPEATIYQILMCQKLLAKLDVKDSKLSNFKLPPGRSSLFKGKKETVLVDSTYNANLDSMTVILDMFGQFQSKNKWIVLGDMLELGKNTKSEHQKLAVFLNKNKYQKIILMGPRIVKYTYPKLKKDVVTFQTPDKVLKYLNDNIKGGETILFKGARFLEGVVEALLEDKSQSVNLVRRQKVWQKRRKKFGL